MSHEYETRPARGLFDPLGNVAVMDIAEALRLQESLEEAIESYTSDALLSAEDPQAVAQDLKRRIAGLQRRLDDALARG